MNSYLEYSLDKKFYPTIKSLVDEKKKERPIGRDTKFKTDENPQEKLNMVDVTGVFKLNSDPNEINKKEYIILHRTESPGVINALNSWTKLIIDGRKTPSVQYTIDQNGTIYKLMSDDTVSWHAGDLYYKKDVANDNSIGIEVVGEFNSDGTRKDLTEAQKRSLSNLTLCLVKKYNIKSGNVCPHENVSRKGGNPYSPNGEGNTYSLLVMDFLKNNYDKSFDMKGNLKNICKIDKDMQ